MAWSTPAVPLSGTVITVAWAAASVVDPILWLRGLTGSGDPPAADRVVRSTSTTATIWSQLTNGCYAAGSITADKFAPLDDISFASGGQTIFFSENLLKILLIPTGAYGIGVDSNIAYVQTARDVCFRNDAAAPGDYSLRHNTATHVMTIQGNTVWHAGNDGTGSGLDADTVDGKHALDLSPVAMIASFPTLADLTAAGASWTRHTAADGRLLVGAGTASSPTLTNAQTFAEATNYGTDWGHGHANTFGASSSTIPAGTTGPLVPTAGGTTQVAETSHIHGAPTISVSGSVTSTVWLPGALRGVIYGRRV